ncbi:MAG: hypothetical protein AB4368_13795 [Xenococcaceae cyanobacterium]
MLPSNTEVETAKTKNEGISVEDDHYEDEGYIWNSEFGLAPDDGYGYWLTEQMANDD